MNGVTVLGAGPYGLAAAAALREAGEAVSVVGEPMSFWEQNMPVGMLLRSPCAGSSIGDPAGKWGLDAFAAATGCPVDVPIPLERFVEYGRWVQARAVPDVQPRLVTRVEREDGGFHVLFEDGGETTTRRLVVAAGIGYFPKVPPVFHGLPRSLVSHASQHRDLSGFAGRRVLVIGAGQSALESAALLHESGAQVEVATRSLAIRWLGQRSWLRELGPVSSVLYAPAEVGPPLFSQLVEAPHLVRLLPPGRRHQLDVRSIRPAGAGWLRSRVLERVPVALGREVVTADDTSGAVAVRFRDGGRDVFDHVLLGTGYRVDLSRYPFLSRDLLSAVRQSDGYPVLRRGFESSVPGLHFVGAPAAWTYGPLMRFVAGTHFVATELTRRVTQAAARGREQRSAVPA